MDMTDHTLTLLCSSYLCIITTFIVSLRVSQHFNSSLVFRYLSIIHALSIICISVFLKFQSSWFVLNPQLALSFSGFSIMSALKFLELAFGYQWSCTREMPLKLAAMYIFAFPKMPESEMKQAEVSKQDVCREGIVSISRGIGQFLLFRILLSMIPHGWLSSSSSSFPSIFRSLRYALLSVLLYLSIDSVTGIGLGTYSVLFKLRMNPVFPKFPYTATSLRDFWSYRWNNYIKSSLRFTSFFVIPNLIDSIIPMNKTARALFAFVLSGFVHEYTLWFLSGTLSGKNMLFFLLHGLLVLLEITVNLPAKPSTFKEKLIGRIWTIAMMLITAPLFFDPLVEAGTFADMK